MKVLLQNIKWDYFALDAKEASKVRRIKSREVEVPDNTKKENAFYAAIDIIQEEIRKELGWHNPCAWIVGAYHEIR